MPSIVVRNNGDAPLLRASVVIATFNGSQRLPRLLDDLARQSLAADVFEVIVIDDGSSPPIEPLLAAESFPWQLTVLAQHNAGPAASRHLGITHARAPLIISVDDDMRVGADFVASHCAAHGDAESVVVLGRLLTPPDVVLPLFEKFHVAAISRRATAFESGMAVPGSALYSGNVSFRRDDYVRVGGFDPEFRLSEDAELGLRFAAAGIRLITSDAAAAVHHSEHSNERAWRRRSRAYGDADARVSAKHPELLSANPWRFLFEVNRFSRPVMLTCALVPFVGDGAAALAMTAGRAFDAVGMGRVAIAGATFAYGAQYFAGLGAHYGSVRRSMSALGLFLNRTPAASVGIVGRFAKCCADIRADHAALVESDAKYQGAARRSSPLLFDLARRIGFQMMVVYRLMRLARSLRLTPFAMLLARLMRHMYGADVHWDADLAPGVVLVHGVGLVVSGEARVGRGCILFQHVTLGVSMRAEDGVSGAPWLDDHVHVGPGAALLGPIRVGRGTKIVANSVLMESVPPQSIVSPAPTIVRSRAARVDAE